MNHVKKEKNHQNIYVMDRGLQSTRTMKSFSKDSVTFICRVKENRKYVELDSFVTENQDLDLGESTLIRDSKVQLYKLIDEDGIQVMLYMTLIVAMLVLVYKKANNIGYKTAKRRF